MKITPKQYADALFQSVSGQNETRIKNAVNNFANLVIENNDVSKINKIIKQFEIIWNKENGIVEAEISGARKLDDKIIRLLSDYISELSGVKEVVAREQIDKNILGGVIIRYGDKVLDGSIKTRLEELKNNMIK